VIILIFILIFELYLLKRVLKYFLLSPIYLYVIFSLLSIFSTIIYFYFFENKFSLFGLDRVSEKVFLANLKMYITALNAFALGVIIYYDLSTGKVKKLYNKSFTSSLFFNYTVPSKTIIVSRLLLVMIMFLYFLAYGKAILIRTEYLPEVNRSLVIMIKILSFVEVILLGIAYRKDKFVSNILFFLLILISMGTASRTVFLLILTYSSILFISQGNTVLNKVKFTLNIFLSFVFLAYLMQLRGLDSHGVIPYIKNIATSGDGFLRDFYFNIYYSLIFGVYVTIQTVQEAQPDWNILFVSLNPLPGFLAGWYEYAKDMRLTPYAPYSLHGRVFTMGKLFTIFYFFMTGLIFSFMERKVRVYLNNGNRVLAFIIILLLILHIVYGFEYNLRSAFRYIYYAIFIIFISYLLRLIKPYLLKKKSNIE